MKSLVPARSDEKHNEPTPVQRAFAVKKAKRPAKVAKQAAPLQEGGAL